MFEIFMQNTTFHMPGSLENLLSSSLCWINSPEVC